MDRLRDYARLFQDDFTHESQRSWSGVYLRGLIQDGERKSIEPMVGRVPLPAQLRRDSRSRTGLAAIRQPESLGRTAGFLPLPHRDGWTLRQSPRESLSSTIPASPSRASTPSACNTNTAANWAKRPTARWPSRFITSVPRNFPARALRLFLPSPGRTPPSDSGGPPGISPHAPKGQIALELLDCILGEGLLPGDVVITDAGYGVAEEFRRQGLQQRGLFYIAGVNPEMVVFTAEPRSGLARGAAQRRPAATSPGRG